MNTLYQKLCALRAGGRGGFTLMELLVVMTIIGLLTSVLTISVQASYKQARQANCKSNLRQFGVALSIYRGEHENIVPDWISNLYPDYVDDKSMYVCHSDINFGKDRARPKAFVDAISDQSKLDSSPFYDNKTNSDTTRNKTIENCSYFYEFSTGKHGWGKDANWPDGDYSTLKLYKYAQLTYGDVNNKDRSSEGSGQVLPYSASALPIIRCYHHWKDQRIYGVAYINRGSWKATKQYITLNVAYAGNVFVGPPWWEGTLRAGETSTK